MTNIDEARKRLEEYVSRGYINGLTADIRTVLDALDAAVRNVPMC